MALNEAIVAQVNNKPADVVEAAGQTTNTQARVSNWDRKILGVPAWIVAIGLFFLGWIFMYADRTILNPIMGELEREFGLTKTQLGLLNSVFFTTYALSQIPAGMLGDAYGRKLVLVPGFIFFGLATAATGLAGSFFMLFLARAAVGIGEGSYYGPQFAISNEAIPVKYRSFGTALINSGMAFGMAIGLMGASYLVYTHNFSWHIPFFVFAVPTILVAIAIMFIVKEDYKPTRGSKSRKDVWTDAIKILKNRNLVLAFFMEFCSLYGFFVLLTWLPYYLQTERGIPGSEIGFISSLIAWMSIPGALLFSVLSDRWGRRAPFAYFMVPIAAVAMVAVVYTTSMTGLVIALVIYGLFGKLAIDPVLLSFVADNTPKENYSTVFGCYNFVGMSSSIIASTLTGLIADHTGSLVPNFYIAAGLLMLGLIAMLFVKETAHQKVS
ncbi:MFS transporter [Microvirga sp. W0021]|uniref:MFS transporter n=1 Tax=Hohaiivirga grylli TaxID=3133970 RepID=A0ABV0BH96_9HYPH